MKKILSLCLMVFSFGALAETPLFYMEQRSGFVPPQYAFRKICEVTDVKATITLIKQSGETVTEKEVVMDATWNSLIEQASKGELKRVIMPADFGYFLALANFNGTNVLIRGLNEDGDAMENTSSAASKLEEIIRNICE